MINSKKQQGFTIIELMFSMLFFSILLISVIMTVMEMSRIYTKGVTMKSASQAGQEFSDLLKRDFASSVSSASEYATLSPNGSGSAVRTLCLSGVAYIWNDAKVLRSSTTEGVKINGNKASVARVTGSGYKRACPDDRRDSIPENIDLSGSSITNPLVAEGAGKLNLENFTVKRVSQGVADRDLYSIEFTVTTNEKENIQESDGRCKPPADTSDNDFSYCAVTKFKFLASTNGKVGD